MTGGAGGWPQADSPTTDGGGSFVLLTDDARILHGPGNKTGWIQASREADRSKLASFPGANALVVRKNTACLLTDSTLLALDRAGRKEVWSRACEFPHALILAGDFLYAGGTHQVAAFSLHDGQPQWQHAVAGQAQGLAAADGALFVSTDEGVIYCFRPGAVEPSATADIPAPAASERAPAVRALPLAAGPFLRFAGPDQARVEGETAQPTSTRITWGKAGETPRRLEDPTPKTNHAATLTGLARDRVHYYTLAGDWTGEPAETGAFECDTFFNCSLPGVPDQVRAYPPDDTAALYAAAAEEILREAGSSKGSPSCWTAATGGSRTSWPGAPNCAGWGWTRTRGRSKRPGARCTPPASTAHASASTRRRPWFHSPSQVSARTGSCRSGWCSRAVSPPQPRPWPATCDPTVG
jgi:hypothetical protein